MVKKLLLFILLVIVFSYPVKAQEPERFSKVEVDIWPEFDDPGVLVIYRIVLPADTSLPADISMPIPISASPPNAVAALQPDGALINLVFEEEPDGEWSRLNFTTTSPEFQVEYYDPGLEIDGKARHFEYNWPGSHAVDTFYVQVQRPVGVSEMRLSPNLGNGVQGNDGLIYYTADVGSLNTGQAFTISLDYVKETDGLSITALGLQSSQPINSPMSSEITWQDAIPWVLGGLGVGLLVGGLIWFWQSGRQIEKQDTRKANQRRKKPAAMENTDESGYIYCHQCGKRAQSNDRFCRACGTALRKLNH